MLKLTTMNLKGFLTELAACCGGVTAEIAGAPVNLNNTAQLRRMYEQDGSLTLELNVSTPRTICAWPALPSATVKTPFPIHHKNTDRVPALKLAGRPCL